MVFPALIMDAVAPLVGAWIEIPDVTVHVTPIGGRSPRGSVD